MSILYLKNSRLKRKKVETYSHDNNPPHTTFFFLEKNGNCDKVYIKLSYNYKNTKT